jgi:long-chain-fatty-acid--CoA ligase ACSBG
MISQVKEALGLDRCKNLFSAAAPIGQDTLKYFLALDMVVLEIFGLTETTGPHTRSTLAEHRLGSVGKTVQVL